MSLFLFLVVAFFSAKHCRRASDDQRFWAAYAWMFLLITNFCACCYVAWRNA